MTPDKTPSDLEIAALRAEFGITSNGRGIKEFTQVADFARAVLAKWGSPVVAGEPYAYAVYFPDQPTEELVRDLDDLCDDLTNREHTITNLFTTPQPTQAQAGAVPDEQLIQQMLNALRTCRVELPGTRFKSASYDESAVSVAITAAVVRLGAPS